MEVTFLQSYIVPAAVAGYLGWRYTKFRKIRKEIPQMLKKGAVIVDVRTPGEFALASREGSINIPLAELERASEKLDRNRPVILCCASGMRSASAVSILKSKGFKEVINAGPWTNTPVVSW